MPHLFNKTFYEKIFYVILIAFFALFFGTSFFVRAVYNFAAYGDNPVLQPQQPLGLLGLLLALAALAVLLHRVFRGLNRLRPRVVVPAVLAASFIVQLGLILLLPRLPTDDSRTVLSLALGMLDRGDYSTFEPGGYLHMFPFNFPIVWYLKTLLALLPDSYVTIKLFNILFSLLTTLMVHLIYRELSGRPRENDYTALLSAACYVPALLMPNLIYNDVIGTALLTSAIYAVLRFVRTRHFGYIAAASALLALGNAFRSIGAIVLIAATLYVLLHLRRLGVRRGLLALIVLAGLFPVPGWTQNAALQAGGVTDAASLKQAAPVYMWLNMGIDAERFGFWDNGKSYLIYEHDADFDGQASVALYKASIADKLSQASPGERLGMYAKKLIWVWTEGTYQIDRYGIGNESSSPRPGASSIAGSYAYDTWLTRLFQGDSPARSCLLALVHASTILMYLLSAVRLATGIRARRFGEVLPVLVLLGFIAFYLLWEIKSRYLYPVYPLLLVLSALGFRDTLSLAGSWRLFNSKKN